MMIFDKARENAEAIKAIGREAIEEGKRNGVPVYYFDDGLGGTVKHMPDGARHVVEAKDAEATVEGADGPRR